MIMKPDSMGSYSDKDVDQVATKWVAQHNHKGSDSHLQPPIDVFHDRRRNATQDNNTLEPEQPVEFRKTAGAFNKSYDFFSQVIDYGSTRIEKFAIYLKLLAKALQTTAATAWTFPMRRSPTMP